MCLTLIVFFAITIFIVIIIIIIRVLRRVFGPKRDDVIGEWRKLNAERRMSKQIAKIKC
jgi:predicted Holliday junction resolvase-like endonuclease